MLQDSHPCSSRGVSEDDPEGGAGSGVLRPAARNACLGRPGKPRAQKCAAGRRECVLVMMSSEEPASAVAIIVPSPLAGEGGSMLPRAMMGEGFVVAATLTHSSSWGHHCALSHKGRGHERLARRSLAKRSPRVLLLSSPRKRGPMITAGGYGSRLSPRCREGRPRRQPVQSRAPTCGCAKWRSAQFPLFPIDTINGNCNPNVFDLRGPYHPHMSPTMCHHPSSSQSSSHVSPSVDIMCFAFEAPMSARRIHINPPPGPRPR
jgi:hypothetical protein